MRAFAAVTTAHARDRACPRRAFAGWWRSACTILGALFLLAVPSRAPAQIGVPPLGPGPYAVACSNVTQDFSRVPAGDDVQGWWEGVDGRYVTDLLADAPNTLAVSVTTPNDFFLFGDGAGKTVVDVVVVCHPTAPDDPRPAYALPTNRVVPHMQRGAEPPLWPDATTRFPLLLFSHGYGGSPLSNDYILALVTMASYGYVVAAPFHGDFRFTDLTIGDLSELFQLLLHLPNLLAMEALRPLALSATIDLMLSHPQWRDRIDPAMSGGFGASQGGQSMLLLAGAGLTSTLDFGWTQIVNDKRLKAAVGYVPYFGQVFLPAFGRDQQGLDGITLPYLAIAGTADVTAPLPLTIQGMNRLAGPRELVALEGVGHYFDAASADDIFTWTVTFLDAHVRGDPGARARLARMGFVTGGGSDFVLIPYNVPPAPNFGGLWWNAPAESEPGWGLAAAHQGDTLFVAWFTYDVDGLPLWMVVAAPRTGPNVYSGTLYRATGPPFSSVPFNPAQVVGTAVGTATFTFTDNDNGTFAYTVGAVQQTKNITRQILSLPVPVCTWGALADLALAPTVQDLWWASPAGIESGWGLQLVQQGNIVFGAWFTYAADGRPTWFVFAAVKTEPNVFSGRVFTGRGSPFNAAAFNPASVIATDVGAATLTFADGANGTFAYSVNGFEQTKPITREIFAPPGTVCQ
jgi:predicted dienelactone hydrolase